MSKTESILDLARNLIKAIDDNTISGQIENNEFCAVVPLQYINDELQILKEWVDGGIIEQRQTD